MHAGYWASVLVQRVILTAVPITMMLSHTYMHARAHTHTHTPQPLLRKGQVVQGCDWWVVKPSIEHPGFDSWPLPFDSLRLCGSHSRLRQKSGGRGASLNDNNRGLLIAGPNVPWDPSVWIRPQVVLLLPISLRCNLPQIPRHCASGNRKILGSIFFERGMCLGSCRSRERGCPASYPGQRAGNWGVSLRPCYMPAPFTLTTSFNPHPLE